MTNRPILVFLAGMAVREFLIPVLRAVADYCDPAGSAPGWTALVDGRVYVPRAWVEMEAGR